MAVGIILINRNVVIINFGDIVFCVEGLRWIAQCIDNTNMDIFTKMVKTWRVKTQ